MKTVNTKDVFLPSYQYINLYYDIAMLLIDASEDDSYSSEFVDAANIAEDLLAQNNIYQQPNF